MYNFKEISYEEARKEFFENMLIHKQNAPVTMIWDMNAEELMNIANKRLCRKASPETREAVQMMCDEVIKVCPEFEPFLVPMCAYTGECKEMYPCDGGF